MIRSSGTVGFDSSRAPVASSRLLGAIATSLAIGTLSLCLVVTLTVLSIRATDRDAHPVDGCGFSFASLANAR